MGHSKIVKDEAILSHDIVATDSEWDTNLSSPWLATVFVSRGRGGSTVFIRDDVPDDVRKRLDTAANGIGVTIQYVRRTDQTDLLTLAGVTGKVRLLHFYSPKDVEYALGWEKFKEAIDKRHVRQRNNLSGRVGKVYIKDVCGWAGKTSLGKFASTLGITMNVKDTLDEYKSCMWRALTERPEEFLGYAVEDTSTVLTIYQTFVEMFRGIQSECLGMVGSPGTELEFAL